MNKTASGDQESAFGDDVSAFGDDIVLLPPAHLHFFYVFTCALTLSAKELSTARDLGAAEMRFQLTAKEVDQARAGRPAQGRRMPAPSYEREELQRMASIADRNKDGQLLGYVWDQIKDEELKNVTPNKVCNARGRELIARMEMLKEGQRFIEAVKYRDFRQVPIKDKDGLDYTRSIREVEPRGALEVLIRYFTDSKEQKRERQQIGDAARQQIALAEARSIRAAEYSSVRERMAQDYYRARGVSADRVVPVLTKQEVADLRDMSERLPESNADRKEFLEGARAAENLERERERAAREREAEQARIQEMAERSREREDRNINRDDGPSRGR